MAAAVCLGGLIGVCGSAGGLSGQARATPLPRVERERRAPFSAAELGFQALVVGSGGHTQGTFLGATATLQAGRYRPLAGVFQLGAGAGLDEDPADPETTRTAGQFWMALSARLRPLAFGRQAPGRAPGLLELYVGPQVGVLAGHEIATLTVGAELGLALRFGRARLVRLSLTLQGGWASVLHQEVADRLDADWYAGGQLGFGLGF